MLLRIALTMLLVAGLLVPRALAQGNEPVVYVFWAESCPFSQRAKAFIDRLRRAEPGMKIQAYDVEKSPANASAHERVLARIGIIGATVVPLIVIGENAHIGYETDETSGQKLLGLIQQCRVQGCPDRISDLLPDAAPEWTAATLASVTLVCTGHNEIKKIGALKK
jgi:glutaredoxin